MGPFNDLILNMSFQDAFEHEGKTQKKIILAKVLGSIPEARKRVKEISKLVSECVEIVNDTSLADQEQWVKSTNIM